MRTLTSRWLALVAIVLSVLTIGLDTTILNVALPTLATDLDADTGELQWLIDSYVLVFAGLLLPMGALGDRFGRKRLLLVGLALFGAASLVAVFADDASQVIAVRAVLGVGAAIITPISLAVLPVMFGPEERRKAVAVTVVGMGLGLPLGPLLGGYLLEHFWWGSIFLVNVPVAAIALIAVGLLVPESRSSRPRRVDLPGGLLSIVGFSLLVYGVIEAPTRGWTDPAVLGTTGGGLVLLVVFVLVERRVEEPMLDLSLFGRARFAWSTVAGALASAVLFGLLFVVPQYLQAVRGHDAMGVGVRLLPIIGGLFVGAPIGARLVGRLGTRWTVALGLLVGAAGLFVGTSTGIGSTYGFVAAWLALTGVGVGFALTPAMDAIMGELPVDEAGSGMAVTMTIRQVAGALGVALLGSLSAEVFHDRVPDGGDSVVATMALAQRLGDPGLAAVARAGYVDAMSAVLLACAVVTVVGAVLVGLFLPRAARPAAGEESGHELTRVA